MHLILHYLKRYKIYVFFNLLAILGFATAELGIPTIVSRMIDNGIILNDRAYIYKMGAAILAVAVAGGIGNVLLAYCSSLVSSRVTRDIRNDIFRKAQEFSHTEYNKFGISSMITRTTNDAFILMQFINIILRTALLTPIMIIISMFMVIRTSMTLSMVIGGCVPIICLGVYLIARTSNPISTRQQKGLDKLNRITRENLTGVRVIRAFCKDEYETERFDQANEDYAANAKKLFKLMSVTQPSFFLLLNLAVSIVFVLSSRLIDMGSLQVGNLVAFQEYMFHAMFSMMMFSLVFVMYPRAEISARRIKELLDEEPLIQNPRNPVTAGDGSGTLVFDHVSFQYPDGEAPVLRDITFEARRGDTIAFIGSTGSGKSTLVNLLPRFYDVTRGEILIDGINIKDWPLHDLRRNLGFVPQKGILFSGTIRSNLAYGDRDAGEEQILKAAGIAQAMEFIESKPDLFDTLIAQGGGNVSGGQKQRLAIARALVKNAPINVFDDSFSALDFKTDARLRTALKEETGNSTQFLVAQRISTIMNADQIIVLDHGRVVGKGTHRELMKGCTVYREIALSQLSEEELQ